MNPQELQEFFNQLPPEIQQKVSRLPEEKQMEVLTQLFQKYMSQQEAPQEELYEQAPMGKYGYSAYGNNISNQKVPVEAERNETLTVKQGQVPNTQGGTLEKKSSNPISGETTYEIPNDRYNNTHENGGVNMMLSEGDVINSDKTKIPFDFKIGNSNYKNKTFKKAADKISSIEKNLEKKYKHLEENNRVDDVVDQTYALMFAKYAKLREDLNSAQETVLDIKSQVDTNKETSEVVARYGKTISAMQKAEEGLNTSFSNYMNDVRGYKNPEKVLKANDGLNKVIKAQKQLLEDTKSQNLDINEIASRAKMYGLIDESPITSTKSKSLKNPIQPFSYNPASDVIQQFKQGIKQKESRAYSNPYIAISGIKENEAASKSFNELKGKAASSALGAYQFVWNIWKNDIKKQTGITDPDEFRANPTAQEEFMDWYIQNDLMPKAVAAKQKYQMPFNVYQIMAGMHLEGEGSEKKTSDGKPRGFIGKYINGQLNKGTKANNFTNASTEDYMSLFADFPDSLEQQEEQMEYGGSSKLPFGLGHKYPRYGKQELFNLSDDNTAYDPKNRYGLKASDGISIWTGDKSGANTPGYTVQDLQDINTNIFGGQYANNKDLQTAIYNYMQAQGQPIQSIVNGKPTSTSYPEIIDEKFGDDWNAAIQYMKTNAVGVPVPTQQTKPIPGLVSSTDYEATKPSYTPMDYPEEQYTDLPLTTNTGDESNTETPTGAKWWQKANYAVDQMLPAANALSLLMEKPIPPTLQRKRARYTPLRTDVDINPQLNEMQRMYLTQSADERGNPSLRNARLAQVSANMISQENQVLANKYNMENQLYNTEVQRRDGYFNQLDDVNRNLAKQYEVETLQTAENVRQQRRMATDYLANLKLRKAEQDKDTKLALANTIYDYDPVTGKLIPNETKRGERFTEKMYEIQLENILQEMQKVQEEKKLALGKEDQKTLDERTKDLEAEIKALKQNISKPTVKKLGGRITSKNQETKEKKYFSNALQPQSNYMKLFPTY